MYIFVALPPGNCWCVFIFAVTKNNMDRKQTKVARIASVPFMVGFGLVRMFVMSYRTGIYGKSIRTNYVFICIRRKFTKVSVPRCDVYKLLLMLMLLLLLVMSMVTLSA